MQCKAPPALFEDTLPADGNAGDLPHTLARIESPMRSPVLAVRMSDRQTEIRNLNHKTQCTDDVEEKTSIF